MLSKSKFPQLFFSILISLLIISHSAKAEVIADADIPTGGTYTSDAASVTSRVFHSSMDPLRMVDFFLCLMDMQIPKYANANFRGLVDEGKCEKLMPGSDPDSTATATADVTMSCTTASNSDPTICKSWFLTAEGDKVLAVIEGVTSPTADRPNGEFNFIYGFTDENSGLLDWTDDNTGSLEVSVVDGITNVNMVVATNTDIGAGSETVAMQANVDLSNHKLKSATGRTGNDFGTTDAADQIYTLDFNDTHAYTNLNFNSTNTATCTALASPIEVAYDYDLYDLTTGVMKSVNSGFPVTVASINNGGMTGSAATVGVGGYFENWGVWTESGYAIHGDTFTVDRAITTNGTTLAAASTVSLHDTGGRLKQVKAGTGTFDNGDILSAAEMSGDTASDNAAKAAVILSTKLSASNCDSTGACFNAKMYIDGSGGDSSMKIRTGEVYTWEGSTVPLHTDVTLVMAYSPVANIAALNSFVYNESIKDYVLFKDITQSDGLEFYYNKSDMIVPNSDTSNGYTLDWSGDQILRCYEQCPAPSSANGDVLQSGYNRATFGTRKSFPFKDGTATGIFYILKADDLSLYLCGKGDTDISGNGAGGSPLGDWQNNAANCTDGNANYKVTCDNCASDDNFYMSNGRFIANGTTIGDNNALWGNANLVYYRWETGSNHWDRLLVPKQGSTLVTLDQPIQFDYVHTAANKRNASDVTNDLPYRLEYAGNGMLWGFDWDCTQSGECTPAINIKDGVLVDIDGDSTNDHIILAKRVDKRGSSDGIAETVCSEDQDPVLSISPSTPKVLQTTVSNANRAKITHTWADKSSVTLIADGEPCVIRGVNQSAVTGCAAD